jgi:ABC-2 type transport system permease protein
MALAMLFFLPAAIITVGLVITNKLLTADVISRYAGILLAYLFFYAVISVLTIIISAVSKSSKDALMRLLGIWLVLVILLPRTTQALGNYLYPSPSKIAFESAIEEDMIKQGDSHNPNDPHYQSMKDSLLLAYGVDSVQQLPFNYSGFVMREGERLSATLYNKHLKTLLQIYEDQNRLNRLTAWVNPYTAIRTISMALSGTDFSSYVHFQNQAEAYRYQLAQTMNELQMKYIGNETPKPGEKSPSISRAHWQEFPDFIYRFQSVRSAIQREAWSIAALLLWGAASVILTIIVSGKIKAI